MKKVVAPSEVAHLWAHQSQDEARNANNNFYFRKECIFSYGNHFVIAKHLENSKVLFTLRTYSNTTSKHISITRQAISYKDIVFAYYIDSYSQNVEAHENNFNLWLKDAEHSGGKLLKAKKPEIYLNELSVTNNYVNKYAQYFGVTIPVKLTAALSIGNKEQYQQYNEKKVLFEKQEKARKEKELKKQHTKELKKWYNFEVDRLYVRSNYDFLRFNGERIQTTQGVKIPKNVALKLYESIKNNTLKIGDKIMDYSIDSIGKEIKIGCHNFKTSYLIDFGSKL